MKKTKLNVGTGGKSEDSGTSVVTSLTDLPPSIISLNISQCLALKDILSLSQTCHVLHRSMIPGPSSGKTFAAADQRYRGGSSDRDDNIDMLWQKILERDFGLKFGSYGVTDKNAVYVIPSQQASGASNLARQGMVHPVRSSFQAYRQWKKTSLIFYKPRSGRGSDTSDNNVNAGYFIRAALIWQQIVRWCGQNGDFGTRLLQTFTPGLSYVDILRVVDDQDCTAAMRAIYAFMGGQDDQKLEGDFRLGLFGSCSAYDLFYSNALINPQYLLGDTNPGYRIGTMLNSDQNGRLLNGRFLNMRAKTGELSWAILGQVGFQFRVKVIRADFDVRPDSVLFWLEEYVRRLTKDIYRVGNTPGSLGMPTRRAIELYPWPCLRENGEDDTATGTLVSRRVTKGIEVVASAVYVPQSPNIGFIYSFRMRLLEDGQQGYVPPQERGFTSAQLQSRHWKIFNKANERTEFVNGDGVIGMYPILEEGGFREPALGSGEFTAGWFQYQSCTGGPFTEGGHFSGHMTFKMINTSDLSPSGHPRAHFQSQFFDVEVGPFELDGSPLFLF